MKKNFFSTIAGATILISILGIASRGFGFIREIIYAGYFGLKSDFESFLVGYVLPAAINTAVIYLGQNYFIPEFTNYKNKHPEKADYFLNKNIWLFFISGMVIAILLFVFADGIIGGYMHNSAAASQEMALNIFRIFILSIPLNAAFAIISAYLHTEFRFTYPAVAQLILNVFVIVFVLCFTRLWGVYSIPFGLLAGNFIQLFFLMWIIRYKLSFRLAEVFKDMFSFSNFSLSLLVIVFIELVNQLHVVVDRYFINYIDKGGIAGLNYAITIYVLPLTIFSFALSSAIFPGMTKLYNENKIEELRLQLLKTLRINSFIFIPISVILIFSGNILIRIFYQRGNFTPEATILTSSLLQIFSFSLLFYSAFNIINKLIFTTGLVKKLFIISASALALKVVLNFVLVGMFKQDGLAYSSSICYIYMSVAGYYIVKRKINFNYSGQLFKSVAVGFFNAVISLALAQVLFVYLLPSNFLGNVIMLSIFLSFFVLNSVLLKIEEIDILKSIFSNYLNRS